MRRILALALLPALLAACAPGGTNCAALPGGAHYCLQEADGAAPFEARQKIDIAFAGRSETLIGQLEADAAGMRFAALTPLGQSLLRAEFAGGNLAAAGIAAERLDAALLLALIQLACWDAGRVRAGLDGSAELIEAENARTLVRDGRIVLRIGYTRGHPPAGDMEIEAPGADVKLRVETLDEGEKE
ncbi:MAG: DUF3261 domain-containing protein [Candidatus Accumulibacter sp.]|jgi:hypothetical protein|nr:DUF3261 domain-containing protein [Accumulibacter sp.]